HRVSHERQFFWGSHVVHHQSEDYNLSTALRQTSTSFLTTWVFFIPCFFLGMPIYMYVSIASAHLVYQFWVHTQHIPKLGVLEWFFVTPSNHRVHHAQNADYIDKNYGGLLIVWDRLFGTFKEEQEDQAPIYGIRTPLKSWNPLWANIHIYANMASDAWRAKKWIDKARVFWARTGWQPSDVAKKYPREKSDLERFEKYGSTLTKTANIVVIAQYLLVSFFHFWGVQNASQLGLEILWLTVVAQAYTLWVIGAVLDGKQLSRLLEYSRLLLLGLGLLTCFWTNLITIDWFYSGCLILLSSGLLMLYCLPPKSSIFASIKTFN
ncbi:MAG: sterol desaturase family protein, partial [Porticoccaceae bacterium]|nr:sterol desaturase family protein [Porticoccaceae bacterium]